MKRTVTIVHIVLAIILVIAEVLGARAEVGALSGTLPAGPGELVVGLGYAALWFLCVIWMPIWFAALLLDAAYGRLRTWISRAR